MMLPTALGCQPRCRASPRSGQKYRGYTNARLDFKDQAVGRNRCRAHVPGSQPDPGTSKADAARISDPNDLPDDTEQEEIARAASVVLGGAEMVLREKLSEYDAELAEVESYDDNVLYRGVNAFTIRLLKRKRAFVEKRIQTIQELSMKVQSCSLDSRCTFLLKSSADVEQLKQQVDQTLDEVFVSGAYNPSTSTQHMSHELWRERTVTMPAMTWSIDDEAKDLEDAIWAAASVAESIEGAYVQVDKQYGSVAEVRRIESAKEQVVLAEVASSVFRRRFPKLPMVDVSEFSRLGSNRPVEAALGALVSTAAITALSSFIIWLFGLSPSLDSILHWNNVLPLSLEQSKTILAWTLPLMAVYAGLGGLRRLDEVLSPPGPLGGVTQAAMIASDRLQADSRVLQFSSDCSEDDMRILYFLATVEAAGIYVPLVYGVLPAVLVKVSGPLMGMMFIKGGFFAPSLLQVPLLTLGTAMTCGTAEVLRTFGDSIKEDARRDSTQIVDSLVAVSDERVGTVRDGRFVMTNDLGGSAERVIENLRNRDILPKGTQQAEVAEAPTSITLDWQTAAAQKTKRQTQEWVSPTVVTLTTAYLCLEAQFTHELAYVAVTQLAAISVMDWISRPWARPNVMVRVQVTPAKKQKGVVLKVEANEKT